MLVRVLADPFHDPAQVRRHRDSEAVRRGRSRASPGLAVRHRTDAIIALPHHPERVRDDSTRPLAAVFVDVLGSDESTARALVGEEVLCRPRQVLLCGSGSLALAFLQEFARGSWEDAERDLRAEGILREFTENTPQAMLVCAPDVIRLPGSWQERLLRSLDQVTGWSRM